MPPPLRGDRRRHPVAVGGQEVREAQREADLLAGLEAPDAVGRSVVGAPHVLAGGVLERRRRTSGSSRRSSNAHAGVEAARRCRGAQHLGALAVLVLEPRLDDLARVPSPQAHLLARLRASSRGRRSPSASPPRAPRRRARRGEVQLQVAVADAARARRARRCARARAARARSQKRCTAFMSWVTKQHRRAAAADARELVVALLLEGGVADGEHLVDEQDRRRRPGSSPRRPGARACPTSSS